MNKVDNKIPFVCIIKTIDLSPVCVGVGVCTVKSNGMTLPSLSFFLLFFFSCVHDHFPVLYYLVAPKVVQMEPCG